MQGRGNLNCVFAIDGTLGLYVELAQERLDHEAAGRIVLGHEGQVIVRYNGSLCCCEAGIIHAAIAISATSQVMLSSKVLP